MTVYHVVLFKLKLGIPEAEIFKLKDALHAMVGQVPGLQKISMGPPVASTASRAKGYDMGVVAILDQPEDLPVYANHPAHMKVQEIRLPICEETLAYDLEF